MPFWRAETLLYNRDKILGIQYKKNIINRDKNIDYAQIYDTIILRTGKVTQPQKRLGGVRCKTEGIPMQQEMKGQKNRPPVFAADHPCGILLENSLFSWHWVICVGWRTYTTGANYMRIVNEWDNTANYFYQPNVGSTWVSGTEYWVG